MEDKSRTQSRQIAEVREAESRFKLRPHLVTRDLRHIHQPVLTAKIEEVLRSKQYGEAKRK